MLLAPPTEAEALHLKPGDKVHIQLAHDADDMPQFRPNEGMLAALQMIAERQKGKRYTYASDTDRMLRDGRAGAIWGNTPLE